MLPVFILLYRGGIGTDAFHVARMQALLGHDVCVFIRMSLVKIAICGLHAAVRDAVQKHSLLCSSLSAPHLINFHQTPEGWFA